MSPSLVNTAKEKIITLRSVILVLIITICYVSLEAFLLNSSLVINTLLGAYSLVYKWIILSDLLLGLFTSMTPFELTLQVLNGLFLGVNLVLLIKTIHHLHGMGGVKISVGGAALISLVTAGCGACGVTILSVLGLSTSLSFLPFHGIEIQIVSLVILIFSSWYMLKKLTDSQICSLV